MKPKILLLSILLVFMFGCNRITGEAALDYSSPENLLLALEDALIERDFQALMNIFNDEDYAFVLRDLFFDMEDNATLHYGFPADEELRKPIITTNDIEMSIPNRIKYFSDDGALTAIYIDTERTKLFTGIVLQRYGDAWKITRMYDFFVFDNPMIDVKTFYLDFFKKLFNVTVMLSDNIRQKGYQTTFLYNTYLLLTRIDVNFHDKTLCSFGKEDVTIFIRNKQIAPEPDNLFMVDELIIVGECDYSSIVSPDLEEKYLLEIIFYLNNGLTIKGYYYGDLRL